MNINIEDYLTEEEIKEIVKEELISLYKLFRSSFPL